MFSGEFAAIDEDVEKQLENLEVELRSSSSKSTKAAETARKLLWFANRRRQEPPYAAKS
jgi:hypothetical protein